MEYSLHPPISSQPFPSTMSEVHFSGKTIIQPASHHSGESIDRIELTPWDLQLLLIGPIQKGLLFPRPTKLPASNNVIDHLRISLSRTLDFFPPLAGRLATVENTDGTTSYFIDCNNAGALFVHSVADTITVRDVLEPVYVPQIVHSFFALNGVQNYQGDSQPLLAVQVTELVDGLFVGCTINHVVADGTSFWHFFNSWSEISRGFSIISRPPVLDRWFPSDINRPISISLSKELLGGEIDAPQLQYRIIHFTKEEVVRLKAKANTEMRTTRISSLQALVAHLWRSIVRCNGIEPEEKTIYRLPLGARERLRPCLPSEYFGNAIFGQHVESKVGDLLEQGLGWVAWQLNKMIAMQKDEQVRSSLKCWVESPKLVRFGPSFRLSGSPRFDVYGNDFGWGKPIAMRSGSSNKCDEMLTVSQGAEEGSVDVEVCLLPEKLQRLILM